MNFNRTWALIERDLRKFFRSPALMMTSMVFPLMQLVVLGYAFGGKVTGVQVAFVDMDHSVESLKIREMFNGIAANARTFHVIDYDSEQKASEDLRNGYVRAVVYVPKDF
jgi:ABC-2 type transport system permease protein